MSNAVSRDRELFAEDAMSETTLKHAIRENSATSTDWRILVVWNNGNPEYVKAGKSGLDPVTFVTRKEAEEHKAWLIDGMGDDAQSINVVAGPEIQEAAVNKELAELRSLLCEQMRDGRAARKETNKVEYARNVLYKALNDLMADGKVDQAIAALKYVEPSITKLDRNPHMPK